MIAGIEVQGVGKQYKGVGKQDGFSAAVTSVWGIGGSADRQSGSARKVWGTCGIDESV